MARFGFAMPDELPKWQSFCNQAADVWRSVTGDGAMAEAYKSACNRNDFLDVAPWTEVGRGQRGLPWGWSTNADFTRNPGGPSLAYSAAAALAPTIKAVETSGTDFLAKKVQEGTEKIQETVQGSGLVSQPYTPTPITITGVGKTPGGLTGGSSPIKPGVTGTNIGVKGTVFKDTAFVVQAKDRTQVAESDVWTPELPAPSGKSVSAVAIGAGALALWYFLRTRGGSAPALSGYSKRRRRRSRR